MVSCTLTPVVGGQDGEMYNDVFGTTTYDSGGFLVIDNGVTKAIDMKHPIKKIVVKHDNNIIRGMSVTYRIAATSGGPGYGNESVTFDRGRGQMVVENSVDFSSNDVLLAVYGRAGYDQREGRRVVHSLNFIQFDTSKGTIEYFGPFGNKRNSSTSSVPFYVTDVVGFGGIHDPEPDSEGLSGLFFVKA